MKYALIILAVAGSLVLAGCGSKEPEVAAPSPAEQGTAKGRLEMDTTDHVSK